MADDRNYGLQALRAVAALSVVYCHVMYLLKDNGGLADDPTFYTVGVDIFFVVSGYIMAKLADGSEAGGRAAARFLWHRFSRLMPVYWAALVFCVMVGHLVGQPHPMSEVLPALFMLPHCPDGASFAPDICSPVLSVSWTLRYEWLFYVLVSASVAMGWRRWKLLMFVGVALMAVLVVNNASDGSTFLAFFAVGSSHPIVLLFLLGIGLQMVLPRLRPHARQLLPLMLTTAGILALVGHGTAGVYPQHGSPLWAAFSITSVAGFLLLDDVMKLRSNSNLSPLVKLGDWSYSIYLSHPVIIALTRVPLSAWIEANGSLPPWVLTICVLGGTVIGSIAVSKTMFCRIEQPCMRRLNTLADRWLSQSARWHVGSAASNAEIP